MTQHSAEREMSASACTSCMSGSIINVIIIPSSVTCLSMLGTPALLPYCARKTAVLWAEWCCQWTVRPWPDAPKRRILLSSYRLFCIPGRFTKHDWGLVVRFGRRITKRRCLKGKPRWCGQVHPVCVRVRSLVSLGTGHDYLDLGDVLSYVWFCTLHQLYEYHIFLFLNDQSLRRFWLSHCFL